MQNHKEKLVHSSGHDEQHSGDEDNNNQALHEHADKGYKLLLIVSFIGALGYLILSFWAGWDKVKEAVANVGAYGILFILFLSVLSAGVRFIKWQIYLKKLDAHIPLIRSLRIYIGGYSMTATPGKAGEAIRSIYLKQHGVDYSKSLAVFFSDILIDLMAMLMLAAVGIWAYPQGRFFALTVLAGIGVILYIVYNPAFYEKIINKITATIHWQKLINILQHSLQLLRHCNTVFQPSVLFTVMFISLIAWLLEAYILHYVAIILLAQITFVKTLFIYAFSKLVGGLSMIPGGLGSMEATLIGLLILNNVEEVVAITCAILLRVATFWFHILMGVVAMPRK